MTSPAYQGMPTKGNYKTFARQILSQPNNVVSLGGKEVTLSTSPSTYYLGVVIDPQGAINQLEPAQEFIPGDPRCRAADQGIAAGQHGV